MWETQTVSEDPHCVSPSDDTPTCSSLIFSIRSAGRFWGQRAFCGPKTEADNYSMGINLWPWQFHYYVLTSMISSNIIYGSRLVAVISVVIYHFSQPLQPKKLFVFLYNTYI